jgi:hypothetical protein
MEQLDTEVVETVAGVARLLRRAAELVWTQADVAGPGSSHQLLALGIDSAADEASGLLPRRAPSWMGPHRLETTQRSCSIQLNSCCAGSVSWVHHPGY